MISVQNLSKTFGEVKAVDNVSFEVAASAAAFILLGAWAFSRIQV
ncbi:MAG: hypothetical protein ABI640_17475 [Gammaproteobacteria bacterium]